MQVSKWGNSLAIRIPAEVVKELKLKEGDRVEVSTAGKRKLEIARDPKIEKAMETIRRLRFPAPRGYKFNRMDAYER